MKRTTLLVLLSSILSFGASAQVLTQLDDVAPFYEDLGGIKKGDSWGFINTDGKLVIDFRKDIVIPSNGEPSFSDGLCMIQEVKDGISYYGYIDTKGEKVIPTEFLAATPFENGYARVIKNYSTKSDTDVVNILGKKVVRYSYNELLIGKKGQTVQHLRGPYNLLMESLNVRRNTPDITSKFLSEDLISVRENDNTYKIYKLDK